MADKNPHDLRLMFDEEQVYRDDSDPSSAPEASVGCRLYSSGQQVLGAGKHLPSNGRQFTGAVWYANPLITKQQHIEALNNFFQGLRAGNFDKANGKLRKSGVVFDYEAQSQELGLDYLAILNSLEISHSNFIRLTVSTPYADSGLENHRPCHQPWAPETCYVFVASHQVLGVPLARLFMATSRLAESGVSLEQVLPFTNQVFAPYNFTCCAAASPAVPSSPAYPAPPEP